MTDNRLEIALGSYFSNWNVSELLATLHKVNWITIDKFPRLDDENGIIEIIGHEELLAHLLYEYWRYVKSLKYKNELNELLSSLAFYGDIDWQQVASAYISFSDSANISDDED